MYLMFLQAKIYKKEIMRNNSKYDIEKEIMRNYGRNDIKK